jgi:hypothetical protein
MSGVDHCQPAEQLLVGEESGEAAADAADRIAAAQVHATLALGAATIATRSGRADDRGAWDLAAAVPRAERTPSVEASFPTEEGRRAEGPDHGQPPVPAPLHKNGSPPRRPPPLARRDRSRPVDEDL